MNKIFQLLEKWYPSLIAGAILVASYIFELKIPEDNRKEIISSSLSFTAIILGFLATSKTIMIGYKENESFKKLDQLGYLKELAKFLKYSLYINLLFSVLLIGMYFFSCSICDCIYFFFGPLSVLSFLRVLRAQVSLLEL